MEVTQHPRSLLIGLFLLAIVMLQGELLFLIRAQKAGRFLPIARNPYLLLDTATGIECLRVPRDRAGEMLNWLVYSESQDDVHDSFTAAVVGYGEMKKHYKEQYQSENPDREPAGVARQSDPILQEILKAAERASTSDADAEKAASAKTTAEFDHLTRVIHSIDSIPVCSKQ